VCPLYDEVNPAESSFSILSTKIEVKLAKGTSGRKWADLEAPEPSPAAGAGDSGPTGVMPEAKTEQPSYPTSSKTGPKDWDKVAKELTSRPKKKSSADKGKDAEGGEEQEFESDDEGDDPVNHFFKKLYKDADEDTRRAMMKSYVESNGTALSTNWKEVGKAPVETSPPGRSTHLIEMSIPSISLKSDLLNSRYDCKELG
jgi:suppressor of G2 allele of SKP1